MSVPEAALTAALATVVDPHTGQPYTAGRQLRNLQIAADGAVSFELELGYPARSQFAQVRDALAQAARTVAGVGTVEVQVSRRIGAHQVQRGVALLPGICRGPALTTAGAGPTSCFQRKRGYGLTGGSRNFRGGPRLLSTVAGPVLRVSQRSVGGKKRPT